MSGASATSMPSFADLRSLLVATTSRGKLREILDLLDGLDLQLRSLADVGPLAAPEETGATFAENARLKASYYARATGEWTVADDSGLVIDALDGAPGVRSARLSGTTYREKFEVIFRALDARGVVTSPARFVCALALADPGGAIRYETAGTVEGEVIREPRGTGGFGYDPIFLVPALGRTLAELPPADKHALSHRGAAFRALRAFLAGHAGRRP